MNSQIESPLIGMFLKGNECSDKKSIANLTLITPQYFKNDSQIMFDLKKKAKKFIDS